MRDLTNLKTFIIDSKDPKEIDDAFSLEIIEGNIKKFYGYILVIHGNWFCMTLILILMQEREIAVYI